VTDFIIVLNPGGPKSVAGTPFSVSDIISMETDELLELANKEGFGTAKARSPQKFGMI
jgi:hypothetical protein